MERGKTWVIHKNTNRGTKSIANSSTLYHLYIPTVILKPLTIIQHVAPGMAYRGMVLYGLHCVFQQTIIFEICFNDNVISYFSCIK